MIPVGTHIRISGYRGDGKVRTGEVVPTNKGTNGLLTLKCADRSTPEHPVYRSYVIANIDYLTTLYPTSCPT